jgi:hypothetical protein
VIGLNCDEGFGFSQGFKIVRSAQTKKKQQQQKVSKSMQINASFLIN